MNDLVAPGGDQLPAHLQQYTGDTATGLITSVCSLPALSIRGKQFRIRKGDEEQVYPIGQPINVVILAVDPEIGVARSFYESAYTGNTDDQPDCSSSDGITPDGHSTKPQARSCNECPWNKFGTATDAAGNPSKGKRCSDHKNLVVVEASNVEHGDLLMLRVPATSLKSLSMYGRKLNEFKVPPQVVITQLVFTDAEHPQLEFLNTRWCTQQEADAAMARSTSESVKASLPTSMKTEVPAEQLPALPAGSPPVIEHTTVTNAAPAPAAAPVPAAPGPKVLVLTEKAGETPLQSFYDAGWSDEQLIEQGYGRYV